MRSAMGNYEGIINDRDDWPDSSRALLFGTGIDEGHRASGDDCMGPGIKCAVTGISRENRSNDFVRESIDG
jgi:hypothetical protein